VLETTFEKVGFLSGCLKRYASSRSSLHEHKRHFMSFTPPRTYPTSVAHPPTNQVTPRDDSAHAHRCTRLLLLVLLCIRYPPHHTLHSASPLPWQTSLSGADLFHFHSLICSHQLDADLFRPKSAFSPSSRYLPPADKSYVWLALCDVVVVSVFVWEAFAQWVDASTGTGATASAFGAGSAARLWLALTFRQTCFLVVSALILIHVRMRRSVSFGRAHWLLWLPFVLLASVSTVAAVLFAHHTTTTSRRRFLIGYVAYSSTIAILNTVMFGSLVGSLITIRRSLANSNQVTVSKESKSPRRIVEKPQVSLATQDIDAVREGGSWITSPASSHRHRDKSISRYSHSTTGTRATQSMAASTEREQAATAPFPFWPSQGTRSSGSPRMPRSSRGDTYYEKTDFGPVHRSRTQSLRAAAATAAALTLSSQGSWISSSLGTRPTLSAWSYPSTPHSSPRDRVRSTSAVQPAITSTLTRDMSPGTTRSGVTSAGMGGSVRARVLASDGQYAPSSMQAERGSATAAAALSPQIEISTLRIVAWLAGVWVPLVCPLSSL